MITKKIHKDLCTNARTRGVKVRAHVLSCAHTFIPCVGACVHGSSRIFFGNYLLFYELQFHWLRRY